jgi:hypothetical protein
MDGEAGCGLAKVGNRITHTCNQANGVEATAYALRTIKAGAHVIMPARNNVYTQVTHRSLPCSL